MDTQVHGPRPYKHPLGPDPFPDGLGDVPNQELLNLEAVRQCLNQFDDPSELLPLLANGR